MDAQRKIGRDRRGVATGRRALSRVLLSALLLSSACLIGPCGRAWAQEPSASPESTSPAAGSSSPDADLSTQALSPASDTASAAPDAAADLARRRDSTRNELTALEQTIQLSEGKATELEKTIAEIEKSNGALRQALVDSAAKRRTLDEQIRAGEDKLIDLRAREAAVHESLKARRGLLAEVLAALQRMGRNPPPALLVTPEDALGSVRSAILLGAVVPGIRGETEKLAADLAALNGLVRDIGNERDRLTGDMTARLEEEHRTTLLLQEKEKLNGETAGALEAERRRAAQLAAQAKNLTGLIGTLESQITSVRQAAEAARVEEAARQMQSEAEREAARARAEAGVPDKNRIAPAYAFNDLRGKLALPATGSVLKRFGDDDGTGHSLQGMMLETGAAALVTAPSDGWIVYAGPFRSYGQMIILNPGDGFHLVLSGMETVNVRQGQFVVAGEPLGTMGATRVASAAALALETKEPTLYIEFRKDGKPVDSQPWWAKSDTRKARNDT
ncbi:hypothetical protein BJF92_19560 [Rhizobium rhizosphaerae]|uniref:M23ase beta-sheet core domain-containing protein n=1 Tax=Xaviernesmea rhizosphaerae TaxID=1672749 RepID=A0A1Q9AL14_9HYPH|nr:murein hydrolase activator EnvC [Xaviernesmea rhizosphaerae]OLP56024.1 hypothetical protein BJF92_19560 [Xaviernesmea rhizosphaerae]